MKFDDIITYAFKNIGFKGLRSWLTIIGIIIGIASVVGLLAYSETVNTQINNQLSTFGSRVITVTPGSPTRSTELRFAQAPGGGSGGFGGRSTTSSSSATLTDTDINALKTIDNIDAISPTVSGQYSTEFNGEVAQVSVSFITPSQYEIINTLNITDGSFINDGSNQIIIGYGVANNVFTSKVSVGDELLVGNYSFKVAGILGQGGFGSSDNTILMDLSQANDMISTWTTNGESYSRIQVEASNSTTINSLVQAINSTLINSRGVSTDAIDFQVSSSQSIINSISTVTDTLTLFLIGIAAISLLVGAISIANTMFTSVYEKTKDIGIMKALGAEDSDVLKLFITESAAISLIGGIGGIILGLTIAQILVSASGSMITLGARSSASAMSLVINPVLIASALLLSLVIGVISGYAPARKAAGMNPIEAIWYEQ